MTVVSFAKGKSDKKKKVEKFRDLMGTLRTSY